MEYNFRDKEKVQFMEYCCTDCLVMDIIETWRNVGGDEVVEVYGNSSVIGDIFRVLMDSELDGKPFPFGVIDFAGEDDYCGFGYDAEYLLTINDDMSVWIQPVYLEHKGKEMILMSDAKVSFVYGGCNSKILRNLETYDSNVMIFDYAECDAEVGVAPKSDKSYDDVYDRLTKDLYESAQRVF